MRVFNNKAAVSAAAVLGIGAALLAVAPSARAQVINIPNGNFDANLGQLGNVQWTNGFGATTRNDGTSITVPGWLSDDGNNLNATDGIHDFNTSGLFPNGGYNGTLVGYVNAGSFTSAASLGTFQANTTYTLSLLVGERSDSGGNIPLVQLLANGTALAPTSSVTPAPVDGFVTWTLTYILAPGSPIAGQDMRIRLGKSGGLQVQYDNVSLVASSTAAPEPATIALLTAGLLPVVGMVIRKRRSK